MRHTFLACTLAVEYLFQTAINECTNRKHNKVFKYVFKVNIMTAREELITHMPHDSRTVHWGYFVAERIPISVTNISSDVERQ